MSGHDATPTVKWECRDCKTFRDEPFQFVGQGVPACGRCCQQMTLVPETVLGSSVPGAAPIPPPPYLDLQDPDTVMEAQDDDSVQT